MKTQRQKLYENIIFALSFLIFSGLILSIIDAYLNIKNKGFNLYKSMALFSTLFYGFISYSLVSLYSPDLPQWIMTVGIIGIVANSLSILTLIVSRIYKFSISRQAVVKHFRGEQTVSTSSARA